MSPSTPELSTTGSFQGTAGDSIQVQAVTGPAVGEGDGAVTLSGFRSR